MTLAPAVAAFAFWLAGVCVGVLVSVVRGGR